MKVIFYTTLFLFGMLLGYSQGQPNNVFLISRVSTAERLAMTNVLSGSQVYDSDTNRLWLYNGGAWIESKSIIKFTDGIITSDAVFSEGNVGINTTNPTEKLDVNGNIKTSGYLLIGDDVYSEKKIVFREPLTGAEIGIQANTNISPQGSFLIRGGAGKPIAFKANIASESFESVINPHLLINTDGNIKVDKNILFDKQLSGIESNYQKLIFNPVYNHLTLREKVTNSGTRLYLVPNGNVANPSSLTAGIKMFSTDYLYDQANYHDFGIYTTNQALIFNSKRNGTFVGNLPFQWRFQDNTIKMQLDSSGNLGIGTITPTQKLEVNGKIKVGDDAEAPTNGTIRYNTTTNKFQGYAAGAWVDLH